jgi:hypothetical protein
MPRSSRHIIRWMLNFNRAVMSNRRFQKIYHHQGALRKHLDQLLQDPPRTGPEEKVGVEIIIYHMRSLSADTSPEHAFSVGLSITEGMSALSCNEEMVRDEVLLLEDEDGDIPGDAEEEVTPNYTQ